MFLGYHHVCHFYAKQFSTIPEYATSLQHAQGRQFGLSLNLSVMILSTIFIAGVVYGYIRRTTDAAFVVRGMWNFIDMRIRILKLKNDCVRTSDRGGE